MDIVEFLNKTGAGYFQLPTKFVVEGENIVYQSTSLRLHSDGDKVKSLMEKIGWEQELRVNCKLDSQVISIMIGPVVHEFWTKAMEVKIKSVEKDFQDEVASVRKRATKHIKKIEESTKALERLSEETGIPIDLTGETYVPNSHAKWTAKLEDLDAYYYAANYVRLERYNIGVWNNSSSSC